MSATKFDNRRQLIVEEVNNIGTTILRCDLYPDSARNLFRADLKNYLEARIAYYSVGDDLTQIQKTIETFFKYLLEKSCHSWTQPGKLYRYCKWSFIKRND